MKISEIRDQILQKQALAQKEKAEAEQAIANMKESISSIAEEDINLALDNGIDLGFLKVIDYNRILTDREYAAFMTEQLNTSATKLANVVERVLETY